MGMPPQLAKYWANRKRVKSKKRGGSMAKTTKRRRKQFILPVAAILGFVPLFARSWTYFRASGIEAAAREATSITTGFDTLSGKWNAGNLRYGLLPLVLGIMVHKFVGGSLGINRALGAARVPIIRL